MRCSRRNAAVFYWKHAEIRKKKFSLARNNSVLLVLFFFFMRPVKFLFNVTLFHTRKYRAIYQWRNQCETIRCQRVAATKHEENHGVLTSLLLTNYSQRLYCTTNWKIDSLWYSRRRLMLRVKVRRNKSILLPKKCVQLIRD